MKRSAWVALALVAVGSCSDDEAATSATTTTTTSSTSSGGGGTTGAGASGGSGGGDVVLTRYLYVSNSGAESISSFTIDADSGALQGLPDTTIAGGPGALAVDPERRFLFAALRDAQAVASFTIDHATGALTHIDSVPVGLNPVYLSVDATGTNLLMADYGGDVAAVHGIESDGRVGAELDSEVTGTNPHSILVDPSNGFAFVPNTNASPNKILQFVFDAQTGQLEPNTPPEVITPAGVGPRHLVFDPAGDHLYVVNEHADSVTTYAFDSTSGTLGELDTVTTLPSGADAGSNTCADIHVTPDGRFVYASNRGHDSIAIFTVDMQSHLPTPAGHQSTEPVPREFEVAGDGRFLYSAGQTSGMLAAYRIDDSSGALMPIDTYPVGAQPLWVLEVAVPQP